MRQKLTRSLRFWFVDLQIFSTYCSLHTCKGNSNWFHLQKLIFLYPLRHIQTELSAKLRQQDISSVAIYKWIKVQYITLALCLVMFHVCVCVCADQCWLHLLPHPGVHHGAHEMVSNTYHYNYPDTHSHSILEYVCSESTLAPSVARADNPSKSVVTREKQLMEKFKVRGYNYDVFR